MNIIKDLYAYRELLKTNITKDVGGKYKHSFLGVLWYFLNPLLQIAVYALVFQVILKSDIEKKKGKLYFLWLSEKSDKIENSLKIYIYSRNRGI